MKKNIVLDLDSTLICSFLDTDSMMKTMRLKHSDKLDSLMKRECIVPINVPNFGGSATNTVYNIVKRPGLSSFLAFCKENFENTIVWSAGHPRYVMEIVKILDPDEQIFRSIYTSNQTVIYVQDRLKNKIVPIESGLDAHSCPDVVLSSKPLSKITVDNPNINLTNTIIVDDLLCNFELPNPKNGVLIPPFKPNVEDVMMDNEKTLRVIADDLCLYRLVHFLSDDAFEEIADVRDYDLSFFKEIPKRSPSLFSL